MSWPASDRFELRTAPDGIGVVQDFLMTGDSQGRLPQADLLADIGEARTWLASAATAWAVRSDRASPTFELSESDLPHLRALRDALFVEVADRSHGRRQNDVSVLARYAPNAQIEVAPDGIIALSPTGRGWKKVCSWLLLETCRSQQNDTWRRLKACQNQKCRGVFYDSSKNNAGAWHDVKTCGNVANLRASRARRRALQSSD